MAPFNIPTKLVILNKKSPSSNHANGKIIHFLLLFRNPIPVNHSDIFPTMDNHRSTMLIHICLLNSVTRAFNFSRVLMLCPQFLFQLIRSRFHEKIQKTAFCSLFWIHDFFLQFCKHTSAGKHHGLPHVEMVLLFNQFCAAFQLEICV